MPRKGFEMWVLFAIILINGHLQTDQASFKSQADCEAAKATITKAIIADGHADGVSLTCFKPEPLGKLA